MYSLRFVHLAYSPFHKTLPKSTLQMHGISVLWNGRYQKLWINRENTSWHFLDKSFTFFFRFLRTLKCDRNSLRTSSRTLKEPTGTHQLIISSKIKFPNFFTLYNECLEKGSYQLFATIYAIYLSLCTLLAEPNSFWGTHCMILMKEFHLKVVFIILLRRR